MALQPGERLGVYEVVALIGAGGMGEVYLARDTQLGRNVALKVLPDMFAADAERVARLRREAQLLAALHHPNIAIIHGLEESTSDGRHVRALVLEYIEGDTLADRIASGPIALDEAIPLALEVGDALQAAHDQGIIHRDLKPSNIKVTPVGSVKVLDFGLAKLAVPAEAMAGHASSVSLSPTITSPAATTLGMILGTAAYMAPEQAKGKTADKRSDVWAFGCVLFEMLTGKRAFEGDDVSDTLASVLKGEPEWSALPADIPVPIRTLLRHCLTKDPRTRVADIAGALFVLRNSGTLVAPAPPAGHLQAGRRLSWRLAAGMALLATAVAATSGWLGWRLRSDDSAPPVVTRYGITLPEGEAFSNVGRHLVAVSRDARLTAYVSANRVNIRPAGRLDARPLRGTEGQGPTAPRGPFFSPDSQWVAFWTASQLKKISVNDGAAQVLATLPPNEQPLGASWSDDGTILYAGVSGIWRVSENSGTPELLLKDDKRRLLHPQLLPGGRALLYTARPLDRVDRNAGWDQADIIVRKLDDGSEQRLAGGTDARYVPTGHVVFVVRGALTALAFDVATLTPSGGPIPLMEGVVESPLQNGVAQFAVSSAGTLAYVTSAVANLARTPVWLDRQGRETPLGVDARPYLYVRLSPDQSRVAFDVGSGVRDIWVWDVKQGAMRPLTTSAEPDRAPFFTHDSSRIIYTITIGGTSSLVSRSADGVGDIDTLLKTDLQPLFASSIAPDGTLLLGRPNGEGGGFDVFSLAPGPDNKPVLLVRPESFGELNADVSHDGHWMAYQSDRSGRPQVVVRPYPALDKEFSVSADGGTEPLWSSDDTELFFRSPSGAIMRVVVKPGKEWAAGAPEQLLPGDGLRLGGTGNPLRTYDVSRDGRRFLVLKESSTEQRTDTGPNIVVIENWLEELKQRVPVK